MILLLRWLVNTLAIVLVVWLLPGIEAATTWGTVLVALILATINTLLRPALVRFKLPINVLTIGLLTLLINGLMLELLAWILGDSMAISGFGWALLAAFVLSVVTIIINIIVSEGHSGGERR